MTVKAIARACIDERNEREAAALTDIGPTFSEPIRLGITRPCKDL